MNNTKEQKWVSDLIKYVKKYFQKDSYDIFDCAKSLTEYLDNYIENEIIMYNVSDRSDLIKRLNVRSNQGKIIRKIEGLNNYLKRISMPYEIIKFKTNKKEGNITKKCNAAWKIIKI